MPNKTQSQACKKNCIFLNDWFKFIHVCVEQVYENVNAGDRDQKMVSDTLEEESQAAVNYLTWVRGNLIHVFR